MQTRSLRRNHVFVRKLCLYTYIICFFIQRYVYIYNLLVEIICIYTINYVLYVNCLCANYVFIRKLILYTYIMYLVIYMETSYLCTDYFLYTDYSVMRKLYLYIQAISLYNFSICKVISLYAYYVFVC